MTAGSVTRRIFDLTETLPPELRRPVRAGGKSAITTARRLRTAAAGVTRRAGERLETTGHARAAHTAFQRAIDLNADCHPAWLWLARSFEDRGDYQGALAAYTHALALRPKSLPAYRRRAIVQRALGDVDGARLTLLAGFVFSTDTVEKARLLEILEEPEPDPELVMPLILESTDPAVAAIAMGRIVDEADPDLIAQQLERWDEILGSEIVRRAIEIMHGRGAIRGSLAAARQARAHHRSAWLDSFISRRTSDVAQLEAGIVELRPQPLTAVEPGGTTSALYLLHNSLPYQSGGYATRTHGLIAGLSAHGHQVVGVTRPGFPPSKGTFVQRLDIDESDRIDGVTYHRLISQAQVLPRKDLDAFAEHYAELLRPFVERYQPALIHAASNWWNGFGGIAAARRAGLPFVYEVRGLWELTKGSREPEWAGSEAYQSDALREASVAMAADRVITISGALRDELELRGVDPSKIVIVPNAVDIDRFAPRDRDNALVQELALGGKIVIGFAGTVTFYEGLDDLLRAVAALPLASRLRVAVVIIGSGPARTGLKQLAAELGIAEQVRFVTQVPHAAIPRYLSVFDIVPFPRLPIPVCEIVPPIKPLESMAMQRAVIVSDVKALSEMVIHDKTGLHFRKGEVDSLRDALDSLIQDEGLRHRLGVGARDWVRDERSWPKVSGAVADLYATLTNR